MYLFVPDRSGKAKKIHILREVEIPLACYGNISRDCSLLHKKRVPARPNPPDHTSLSLLLERGLLHFAEAGQLVFDC